MRVLSFRSEAVKRREEKLVVWLDGNKLANSIEILTVSYPAFLLAS